MLYCGQCGVYPQHFVLGLLIATDPHPLRIRLLIIFAIEVH